MQLIAINKASESWLVSPSIYIYFNGIDKTYLTFEQAVNNGFGDIAGETTLWVRELGGEWQNVAIAYPEAPADGSLSGFETQTVDLTAYLDAGSEKRIQFAFKYTSSAEAAGTWSIRNVSVKGYNRIFAFIKSEVEVTISDVVTHPALVNEYEGGTISYSSSDTDVATIDEETGVVRLVSPSQTSIIATLHGNGDI